MKIKKVETFSTRNMCLVRITTEDGLTGWGQTAHINADISAAVLHRHLAKLVLDKNSEDIEAIGDLCVDTNYTFFGSYLFRALTGIDTALWDIRGKRAGKSVARLLGSDKKFVDVYGSSMVKTITPREEIDRMKRLGQENGFRAFKVHIGNIGENVYALLGRDEDTYPGHTEEVISLFRKEFGDDVPLFVDSNGTYSVEKAIEIGRFFEKMKVGYFEEPCPYWEFEKSAAVARALNIPVAGGEQDYDMAQWKRIFAAEAVRIAQPDICYIGGFSRAWQVAKMSEKAGVYCSPHNGTRGLLLIFSIHMNAALKNPYPFLEYSIDPQYNDPWNKGLFTPVVEVRDGKVAVPQEPGWGIEPNLEWLAKTTYAVTE